MTIRGIIILAIVAVGLVAAVRRFAPGASRLAVGEESAHFPVVSGFNLERQEFEFPRDFEAPYNVVFIAFQRWHQDIVDTWVPFVQELEAERTDLIYYELPTINEMPAMGRLWVNEGMRAGIPNPTARQRTVTLYIDTDKFNQAVDIPNRDDVHILLVSQEGQILWRSAGRFDEAKGAELVSAVEKYR